MATALIKFGLDRSGINPLNLVTDETHTTLDPVSGIIIPKHGRYFTESLVITEDTNSYTLIRGEDFVPIEFDQKSSIDTGKEICKAIIIINPTLVAPFTISYQVLGGDHGHSNENLLAVMQDKILPNTSAIWELITEKPEEFLAKPHLHDIREVYGFEYITKALNRIRDAIVIGAYPSFQSLLSFMDGILDDLKSDMQMYLDQNMDAAILEFKSKFNKQTLGVEKLSNFQTAKVLDGENAGRKTYKASDITFDKFMTIEALVGLKKHLFTSFIKKQLTNTGLTYANYFEPKKLALQGLTNTSVVRLISREKAIAESIPYDGVLYPNGVSASQEIVLQKVSNNKDNAGGVYVAYDESKEDVFIGAFTTTSNDATINWKRLPTTDEVDEQTRKLQNHVENYGDAHLSIKGQMELGNVENLQIADRTEILAMRSVYKYITFDNLLLFMDAYVLQNGLPIRQLPTPPKRVLLDNCVVVYSPAGIGCEQRCDFTNPPPPTQPTLTFVKVSQYCTVFDESVRVPVEDTWINDTGPNASEPTVLYNRLLIGVYRNPSGVQFEQPMRSMSYCCGYRESIPNFYFLDEVGAPLAVTKFQAIESAIESAAPTAYIEYSFTLPVVGVVKVSGLTDARGYYYITIHAGSNTGNGSFEVKVSKAEAITKTRQITIGENDTQEDPVGLLVYLHLAGSVLKQGSTMAGIVTVLDTVAGTNYNLEIWDNDAWVAVSNSGAPANFTGEAGITRVNFNLNYAPSINYKQIFARVTVAGSTDPNDYYGSNRTRVKMQAFIPVTKTIPFSINGTASGTMTLTRDTVSGLVTITPATQPTGSALSNIYVFNKTTNASDKFVFVIDAWKETHNNETYTEYTSTAPVSAANFELVSSCEMTSWTNANFACEVVSSTPPPSTTPAPSSAPTYCIQNKTEGRFTVQLKVPSGPNWGTAVPTNIEVTVTNNTSESLILSGVGIGGANTTAQYGAFGANQTKVLTFATTGNLGDPVHAWVNVDHNSVPFFYMQTDTCLLSNGAYAPTPPPSSTLSTPPPTILTAVVAGINFTVPFLEQRTATLTLTNLIVGNRYNLQPYFGSTSSNIPETNSSVADLDGVPTSFIATTTSKQYTITFNNNGNISGTYFYKIKVTAVNESNTVYRTNVFQVSYDEDYITGLVLAMTSATMATLTISGLVPGTPYDIEWLQNDAALNAKYGGLPLQITGQTNANNAYVHYKGNTPADDFINPVGNNYVIPIDFGQWNDVGFTITNIKCKISKPQGIVTTSNVLTA